MPSSSVQNEAFTNEDDNLTAVLYGVNDLRLVNRFSCYKIFLEFSIVIRVN